MEKIQMVDLQGQYAKIKGEMDSALQERVIRRSEEALKGAALLLATHSGEEAQALGCRVLRYDNGRFV